MNDPGGGDCPDWCRRHRRTGVHESLSQVAEAAIDGVAVDLAVSAARRDGRDGPRRAVFLRIGDGWVVDLDPAQAKRLCTLITAAATLP